MGVSIKSNLTGIMTEFRVQHLTTMLQQTGEKSSTVALDEMRNQAVILRDLARSYAPVDKGNLEEAIQILEDYGGLNRRKRVFVYVNTARSVGRGKSIGTYAMAMHEALAPYGSGSFRLGRKSRAKRAAGNKVGGKFMSRARRDRAKAIVKAINDRVMRRR